MLSQQIGNINSVVSCLLNLARVFCANAEPERGARLLGAVYDPVHVLSACAMLRDSEYRETYERTLAAARAPDEAQFTAAFTEGQMMTLDWAIDHALADGTPVEIE